MKTLLALFAISLSLAISAQANDEVTVKCDVRSLRDASECLSSLAKALPEYEEPNDALVTDKTDKLVKYLKATGADKSKIRAAQKADFAGLIVEHGDEHKIYYYTMKKGSDIQPVEIDTLYVVDMPTEGPFTADQLKVDTYFLGLSDARAIDVYSDIEEFLAELEQN